MVKILRIVSNTPEDAAHIDSSHPNVKVMLPFPHITSVCSLWFSGSLPTLNPVILEERSGFGFQWTFLYIHLSGTYVLSIATCKKFELCRSTKM